jgi:CRP-like cAMP-binding protein
MDDLVKKMKEDYDSLHAVGREDYLRLGEFLQFRRYPKKEVIRREGIPEDRSRYVFEGVMASYEHESGLPHCRRIYSETDTVCDFESYATGNPSRFSLVALTDCVVCELPKERELEVVAAIPAFGALAIRINQRITVRDSRWKDLLLRGDAEKYASFQRLFPRYGILAVKDIASLLNIPERTMFRLRGSK